MADPMQAGLRDRRERRIGGAKLSGKMAAGKAGQGLKSK
jgi:hypothetical protein